MFCSLVTNVIQKTPTQTYFPSHRQLTLRFTGLIYDFIFHETHSERWVLLFSSIIAVLFLELWGFFCLSLGGFFWWFFWFVRWLVLFVWGWGRVIGFLGFFFEGFILIYSFNYVFPDDTWSKRSGSVL